MGLVERSMGKHIIDEYDLFLFTRFEPCDKQEEQMKQKIMEEWIIKHANKKHRTKLIFKIWNKNNKRL